MTTRAQDTALTGGRGSPNAWSPGSDSNNWTVQNGALTLAFTGSRLNFNGGTGVEVLTYSSVSVADVEVSVRCYIAGVGDNIGIVARVTASNTYYVARFVSGVFFISRVNAGVSVDMQSVSITETAGTASWLKLRTQGSTISGKYWQDSGGEPVGFQLVASDNSITAAGNVGVRGKPGNSTNIIGYDTFLAVDPPALPIGGRSMHRSIGRIQ